MRSQPGNGRELLAILARRPRPSAACAAALPAGRRFDAQLGPTSSVLVAMCVIALLGDVPCSLVLVSALHPAHPHEIHAALFALALATLGWAVAARSARRAIPHVVTDASVVIHDGLDLRIEVPRSAVVSVQLIGDSRRAWLAQRGIARHDVLRASLLDAPNMALEVDVDAGKVRVSRRGRAVAPRRWILFYADEPALMRTMLASPEAPA